MMGKATKYNTVLWQELINLGHKTEKGDRNHLTEDEIETIIATMEFFGATEIWMKQTIFDLKHAKYRIFDWLAMCVMSRNDDDRTGNNTPLKVLVHSYKKCEGNVRKFIEDLRETDYQIDESWNKILIDITE